MVLREKQGPVPREAREILRGIDAEVRRHCAGGEFVSYTKTDIPDGKGGVLTAQEHARRLAFREIAGRLSDTGLEAKIGRILKSDPKDERKVVFEMGWEKFEAVRSLLGALSDEARALGREEPQVFGHDVLSNATGTPRSTFDSIHASMVGEARKALNGVLDKVKEHCPPGKIESITETDEKDLMGKKLQASVYASDLLVLTVLREIESKEARGKIMEMLYASSAEDGAKMAAGLGDGVFSFVREYYELLTAVAKDRSMFETDVMANASGAVLGNLRLIEHSRKKMERE